MFARHIITPQKTLMLSILMILTIIYKYLMEHYENPSTVSSIQKITMMQIDSIILESIDSIIFKNRQEQILWTENTPFCFVQIESKCKI